jgi:hypothetical protein
MSDGPTTPLIVPRGAGNSFAEHRVLDQVDLTFAEGTSFSMRGRHPRQSRSALGPKLGDVLMARSSVCNRQRHT